MKKQKQAAAAWSWCEHNFSWNFALRLSLRILGQEEEVKMAVAGEQVDTLYTIFVTHLLLQP